MGNEDEQTNNQETIESWGNHEFEGNGSGELQYKQVYHSDRHFYRTAVHYLGFVLVVTIIAAAAMVFFGKEIPQFLVAISSGIVGIFAGIFGVRP